MKSDQSDQSSYVLSYPSYALSYILPCLSYHSGGGLMFYPTAPAPIFAAGNRVTGKQASI